MTITNIVLIHHLVEDLDLLGSAFKNSIVVRYKGQDKAGVLLEISGAQPYLDYSNISHLALVFHPDDMIRLPFFRSTSASQFHAMSQGLVDLIVHLKGEKPSIYVDLLACSMRHSPFVKSIKLAEQQLQVQFRYSLDDTGNAMNWVLESHGEDVKDHYFNDNILQWHHVLFPNWAASTFGPQAPFFKLIYDESNVSTGQVQRLHQEIDIHGNPLNPLLDDNGVNIDHGPATVVQIGTGSSWFGDDEEFQAKFDLVKDSLTNVKSVVGTELAYAALKTDNTVVLWGYANWDYDDIYDWQTGAGVTYPLRELNNVKALYATAKAFAALRFDGTVVTWGGDDAASGDSSQVQDQLTNVSIIYANHYAFAALKTDGTVVTWGIGHEGGDSSGVQSELTNVVAIYSTTAAFAALRSDGTVIAWGSLMDNEPGQDLIVPYTVAQPQLVNVVAVYSTNNAFAALKVDGTVVTWGGDRVGSTAKGGNSSAVQTHLHDVTSIHAAQNAFAAVKADGSVVTWGDPHRGGNSSGVELELSNVVTVYSTIHAFAALKSDGSVVTWGLSFGFDAGDSSAVQEQLKNVTAIYSTVMAFAALKSDGSVVTWGSPTMWSAGTAPSDSTAVQSELTDIVTIFSNGTAFAALKDDGTLVTWGADTSGGNSSSVQSELVNVKYVYTNYFNMVALVETLVPDASPAPDPASPNAPPATVRFAVIALASAITRSTDGSVFIAADVQIKMKSSRFNKDDAALARQQLQDWISEAEETSDRTAVSPFSPIIPQGSVLRVFTSGDTLFVHNQSINLAGLSESEENVTVYTHEGSVYQATVVFYGGSGGAEIENVGTDTDGAQTFAPDQVVYASTSDDGNVTIFAGIVSQGTDSYAVGAPRLPSTDTLYTTDVSVSVAAVNGAMAPFAFTFDEQMQQVTITSTGALQSKALLSDVLFDSRRMSNGERRQHAENCLMALTDQIANDIPDEFTSGEEAMLRLGISIQTMDEMLQGTGATNPTHALVQNIRGTSWGQGEVYSTYGSSLLRNIVLSLCSMKSSRVQSGKAVLAAGDEIVFYVTFTGVIRVSAGRELERFGLTQIEIEQNQAALDQAAWVKYRCRLVR